MTWSFTKGWLDRAALELGLGVRVRVKGWRVRVTGWRVRVRNLEV